jgi:hypothetical protein
MMLETRISSSSDFRNVDVFEQIGPNGKSHRLAFVNREWIESYIPGTGMFGNVVLAAGLFVTVFIVLPLAFYYVVLWIIDHHFPGWLVLIALLACVAAGLYLVSFVRNPRDVRREIILDYGADRLRLLANGRPAGTMPLMSMTSLTIEPHPMMEAERLKRLEKKQSRPSVAEKTHCLFGYFGPGGANKVRLVSRFEWPSRDSLREVRAAILWAIDQAGKATPKMEGGGTIKPPLD